MYTILAINPGSTTTKIGLFEDEKKIFEKSIFHPSEELSLYNKMTDQYEFRKKAVRETLAENGFDLKKLSAIAARGGITEPIASGTYRVTDSVVEFQKNTPHQHPSNLAAIIGREIGDQLSIETYFVDAPTTYELFKPASFSGIKEIERLGRFHALNQKMIAKKYAAEAGKRYGELNLIVAHIGGGVSVGAHRRGQVIDVNDAIGEGPFTPERSGALPARQLVDLCFSGEYSYDDVKKMIQGNGGLKNYLNSTDLEALLPKMEKEPRIREVLEAMCYQIAQEVGARAVALRGVVDRILLTGGVAHSSFITDQITEWVSFLGPVSVYPGEHELEALALGVLKVLKGEETPKEISFS